MASKSSQQAIQAASSLVNKENPSWTAFGCALDADARLVSRLLELSSKQNLSQETKASVQEALKAALENLTSLAQGLDDMHLNLAEVDPMGSVFPQALEEKLRDAIKRVSGASAGMRETQRKISELQKYRSAISDVQKRVNKYHQQQEEVSKVSTQLQTTTEQIAAKQAELVDLDAKIKNEKQALKEKEVEINEKRKELQSRLQEAMTKMESLKQQSSQQSVNFSARKRELENEKYLLQERINIARLEIAEKQATLAIPAVAAQAANVPMGECSVCTQHKPLEDMVILFNCMHNVCSECMLAEINDCRRNNRNFKFAICPSCYEDVELFDGKAVSGSVKINKEGIIIPEIRGGM